MLLVNEYNVNEYNEYNEYETLFWVHMVKTVQHKLQELLMDYVFNTVHKGTNKR